jgi:hypothetical protein
MLTNVLAYSSKDSDTQPVLRFHWATRYQTQKETKRAINRETSRWSTIVACSYPLASRCFTVVALYKVVASFVDLVQCMVQNTSGYDEKSYDMWCDFRKIETTQEILDVTNTELEFSVIKSSRL